MSSKSQKVKSSDFHVKTTIPEMMWKIMLTKAVCERLDINYKTLKKVTITFVGTETETEMQIEME
jgi:hypothetical protein